MVNNYQISEIALLVGWQCGLGLALLFSLALASHSLNVSSALLRRSFSCSSFRAASSCEEKNNLSIINIIIFSQNQKNH